MGEGVADRSGEMMAKLLTAFLAVSFLPCLPQAKVCDITDFGAKGDGKTNDTEAFLQAFAACAHDGLPRAGDEVNSVLVPKGGVFLTWPLVIEEDKCSYLSFTVLGKIVAPPEPSLWTYNESFMYFKDCKNFAITGGKTGVVDGVGQPWWKAFRDHGISRPYLIKVYKTDGLNVTDITLIDSPKFHLVPESSQNVFIAGVTITAPGDSPNTDGIDPSDSQHVTIRNCNISTGDDNVALKPGTNDVLIENCWFGTGHGCSIGSISSTGVWDVVVRNITFVATVNGARIKTWQGGSGKVENVTYSGLRFVDVDLPIDVDMYYCPHKTCKNSSKGVTIKGVTLEDITGTQSGGRAGQFFCSDSVPCTDIHLQDIDISSKAGNSDNKFYCWSAYGTANNVTPKSCLGTKT